MKLFIILISISMAVMMNCSETKNISHCDIYLTNLDVRHELFTHQLSDEKYHFAFGVSENDFSDLRKSKITIARAKVGDERNWIPFSGIVPGVCQSVCQTDKYIYLLSRIQFKEPQDPKYSKHKLYRISKEDGLLSELYEWDIGNSFIRDIFFTSEEKGFVVFRPSGNPLDYQIYSTVNAGKEWSIVELEKPVLTSRLYGDCLYFLSYTYNRNGKTSWIHSIGLESNELDSFQFELNITDFAVEANREFWLLGKDGDRTVLKYHKDEQTSEIMTFSEDAGFSPKQLYKYNDVIVVLASQVDKSMLGGFGGTKPGMHLSIDNGLTWTSQTLDEALYLKPVSFYKDERMATYIGQGKVLACSFKK